MKLTFKDQSSYSEESQSNPIRWAILSGTPEKGFVNESAWLKCKDFFNDYAVAYNGGTRFGIYGFNTTNMTIPKLGEPVYMAVKCLTKNFMFNMNTFNTWLKDNGHLTIPYYTVDKEVVVLEFDQFFLKNTYNISLVSLMIRLLNDETFNGTIEDLKTHKIPGDGRDQQKWGTVVAKNIYFKLPKKLDGYLWYCGEKSNSNTEVPVYQLSGLVHNNGVVSWSSYM